MDGNNKCKLKPINYAIEYDNWDALSILINSGVIISNEDLEQFYKKVKNGIQAPAKLVKQMMELRKVRNETIEKQE